MFQTLSQRHIQRQAKGRDTAPELPKPQLVAATHEIAALVRKHVSLSLGSMLIGAVLQRRTMQDSSARRSMDAATTVLYHSLWREIGQTTPDSLKSMPGMELYVANPMDHRRGFRIRTAKPGRDDSNACSNSKA